jgi:hypothetical protein
MKFWRDAFPSRCRRQSLLFAKIIFAANAGDIFAAQMKDYYKILGVPRNASTAEIKQAHSTRSMELSAFTKAN